MRCSGTLREWLAADGLIMAPGVYDALTARLAEAAGFPAGYMSGYATAASFGVTDTGIIGFPEMLANAARIAEAIAIPLIADADTGYDDPAETTRRYEVAGVAAIQLEDQAWPKKCGHMDGKLLVSAQEMCERIRAAVNARSADGIVVIARTDAIAVEGVEAAIARAELYAEAGADVLFVEAPVSIEQLEAVPKRLPRVPQLYNAAPRTPSLPAIELERLGYKIAIYPGLAFAANFLATRAALDDLRRTGEQANLEEWRQNFAAWNGFLSPAR
jgi:2-methylisocitrate lyase-like PEP mutase family enzyme